MRQSKGHRSFFSQLLKIAIVLFLCCLLCYWVHSDVFWASISGSTGSGLSTSGLEALTKTADVDGPFTALRDNAAYKVTCDLLNTAFCTSRTFAAFNETADLIKKTYVRAICHPEDLYHPECIEVINHVNHRVATGLRLVKFKPCANLGMTASLFFANNAIMHGYAKDVSAMESNPLYLGARLSDRIQPTLWQAWRGPFCNETDAADAVDLTKAKRHLVLSLLEFYRFYAMTTVPIFVCLTDTVGVFSNVWLLVFMVTSYWTVTAVAPSVYLEPFQSKYDQFKAFAHIVGGSIVRGVTQSHRRMLSLLIPVMMVVVLVLSVPGIVPIVTGLGIVPAAGTWAAMLSAAQAVFISFETVVSLAIMFTSFCIKKPEPRQQTFKRNVTCGLLAMVSVVFLSSVTGYLQGTSLVNLLEKGLAYALVTWVTVILLAFAGSRDISEGVASLEVLLPALIGIIGLDPTRGFGYTTMAYMPILASMACVNMITSIRREVYHTAYESNPMQWCWIQFMHFVALGVVQLCFESGLAGGPITIQAPLLFSVAPFFPLLAFLLSYSDQSADA